MPEMFVEVAPELAELRGLTHGDYATVITLRAAIEGRVLVTERMTPLRVQGRVTHLVGLPYHWGVKGYAVGDSANDLLSLSLDPNVQIGEYKAATCDIRPGRRPRGEALRELLAGYRHRVEEAARV
jgi:formate dehydrogenase major subunit